MAAFDAVKYSGLTQVAKLLADHAFTIRTYQRGYSWKPKQVKEMLSDLAFSKSSWVATSERCGFVVDDRGTKRGVSTTRPRAARASDQLMKKECNNLGELLGATGGMICTRRGMRQEVTVVDGQQRLTTYMMIVRGLGEAIENLRQDPDVEIAARDIRDRVQTWELSTCFTDDTRVLDIIMSYDADREELLAELLGAESKSKLAVAYRTVRAGITKMLASDSLSATLQAMFYLDRVVMCLVTTDDMTDAKRLFTLRNDRGLAVDQLTLFRNKLMMHMEEGLEPDVQADRTNALFDAMQQHESKLESLCAPQVLAASELPRFTPLCMYLIAGHFLLGQTRSSAENLSLSSAQTSNEGRVSRALCAVMETMKLDGRAVEFAEGLVARTTDMLDTVARLLGTSNGFAVLCSLPFHGISTLLLHGLVMDRPAFDQSVEHLAAIALSSHFAWMGGDSHRRGGMNKFEPDAVSELVCSSIPAACSFATPQEAQVGLASIVDALEAAYPDRRLEAAPEFARTAAVHLFLTLAEHWMSGTPLDELSTMQLICIGDCGGGGVITVRDYCIVEERRRNAHSRDWERRVQRSECATNADLKNSLDAAARQAREQRIKNAMAN